jgi:uncharacterized protein (DUF983 family)
MKAHTIATKPGRHTANGVVNDHLPEAVHQRRSSRQQVLEYFARALLLRCSVCGKGGILSNWFKVKPKCPSCGYALQREEGYYTGAMALNLLASEFIVTGVLLLYLVKTWPLALTWPSPELQTVWYVSIAAAGLLPILAFPFARTIWIAFDLTFRPPTPADFEEEIPTVR